MQQEENKKIKEDEESIEKDKFEVEKEKGKKESEKEKKKCEAEEKPKNQGLKKEIEPGNIGKKIVKKEKMPKDRSIENEEDIPDELHNNPFYHGLLPSDDLCFILSEVKFIVTFHHVSFLWKMMKG